MDESLKYAKWKKANTKDHIAFHSSYMKHPKQAVHRDRNYISVCMGMGEGNNTEWLVMDMEFLSEWWNVLKLVVRVAKLSQLYWKPLNCIP